MLQSYLKCLQATHGKARQRPMIFIGQYRVISLYKRNDIVHQIFREQRNLALQALGMNRSVGHHHHHRLHLTLGHQVIKDQAGGTYRRPSVIVISAAMDQI